MPSADQIDRLHEAMCVWKTGYVPEDLRQVRTDLLAVAADLNYILDECCQACGKPEIGYRNYRDEGYCVPCANGGQAT